MKNNKKGISLIVLVITIIVIIILAAAVILTLNNNNPIAEANDARYASDVANMQALLTNTVAKIMAANQSTITITKTKIPDTALATTIPYTLDYPTTLSAKTGTIAFTTGTNTVPANGVLTTWVTGKALPNYTSGTETWSVNEEGTLGLKVENGSTYGSYEEITENVTEPEEDDDEILDTELPE